jgi:hypothetical protein
MASNNQESRRTSASHQASTAETTTPSPSMWPPVYSPPRGEQFREYARTIDFDNMPDVDDMFTHPTQVPGYESYPAPPVDRSVQTTPFPAYDMDGEDPLSYWSEMLSDLEDDLDSESGWDSEDDSDYENDSNADETSVHATPAPRSMSRSPPLAPLRAEDFPPLRGIGLGKTIHRRPKPRVAQPPIVHVEAAYPNSPLSNSGIPPRRDSSNSRPPRSGDAMDIDNDLYAMGLTPGPTSGGFRSISTERPRIHDSGPSDIGSSPYSPQPISNEFASTGSVTSFGARISAMGASPYSPQPSHYTLSITGSVTSPSARTSAMGSSPYSPQPSNYHAANAGGVPGLAARTSTTGPPPNLPQHSNYNAASTGSIRSFGARAPAMVSSPYSPRLSDYNAANTGDATSLSARASVMGPPPSLPQPGNFNAARTGSATTYGARPPIMGAPSNLTPTGRETLSIAMGLRASIENKRANASLSATHYQSGPHARHSAVVNTGSEMAASGSRAAAVGALPIAHPHGARLFHAPGIPARVASDMGPPLSPTPHDVESMFVGYVTVDADPSDMGPPPKRQCLSGSFPHTKQYSKLHEHLERAETVDHRHEQVILQAALLGMEEQSERSLRENRILGAHIHPWSQQHFEREYSNRAAEAQRHRFDGLPHRMTITRVRMVGELLLEERGFLARRYEA